MLRVPFGGMAVLSLRTAGLALLLVLMSASYCYSSEIVFIRSSEGPSAAPRQLEIASSFYGLNLRVVTAPAVHDATLLSREVKRQETIGVVIAVDALPLVDEPALLRALHRAGGSNVPVLILRVEPNTDPALLRAWSDGSVVGCEHPGNLARPQYVFGKVDGFTRQLTGVEIPLAAQDVSYLLTGERDESQRVASIRDDDQAFPVAIETVVQQVKVFMASAVFSGGSLTEGQDLVSAFLRVAPEMMFVRYCAGERGWHSVHHYANLTIDDPWLRQPYGYVDYEGLLEEMEKHNFHTTIAFIPWNYDRSQPEVVSLFRNHPERFSIAIHGNNHDHKEFTDYRSRPLAFQVGDLKQALARMEKFSALTGIPYDKIMIFPHSIAPEGTLEALKTYNYLATVNSTNVPQGGVNPSDLSFSLRPVTLSFGNFASVSRYSVTAPVSEAFIAINQFLDNPLLFYGHSDFFAKGIDAFDGVADDVDKLAPDTQWRGLGDVAKHLYAVKLRDDSNYDVAAFSSDICLENITGRDATFYVRRQETEGEAIKSVSLDGKPYEYRLQNGYLSLIVPIPMSGTRCVAIRYKNDLELASISTSHHSVIVYLLRMGSDFRDIYLSKFPAGLALIRFYNEHELKPAQVVGCLVAFLVLCIYAGYRLRVFAKKVRSASRTSAVA